MALAKESVQRKKNFAFWILYGGEQTHREKQRLEKFLEMGHYINSSSHTLTFPPPTAFQTIQALNYARPKKSHILRNSW